MSLLHAKTELLDIVYEDAGGGDAPAVVLLHGWPDDIRGWRQVAPRLHAALSHTAGRWARCLGPVVEEVAQTLYRAATQPATRRRWISSRRTTGRVPEQPPPLPTPLTETNRRKGRHGLYGDLLPGGEGKARHSGGGDPESPRRESDSMQSAETRRSLTDYDVEQSARQLLTAVLVGVEPLSRAVFLRAIVPALRGIPAERIAERTGLSVPYCAKILTGRCAPGRKHWETFRRFVLSRAIQV
jgi:hypothetical protein